jgi:hypothetical protein
MARTDIYTCAATGAEFFVYYRQEKENMTQLWWDVEDCPPPLPLYWEVYPIRLYRI